MLLGILNGRFKGDAQNDIESWERDNRSFEKQTSLKIPDFVKAGILINGLQEEPLRRHMVLHTSRLDTYEKLRLEVTEIARAKIMAVNSVPMEVDSLRFKGKGKWKSKDHKEKGKPNQGKGARGMASLQTRRKWTVTTAVRKVTRSLNAYDVNQTLRRRNLKVDLQYLLNLYTRFMKFVTLLLLLRLRTMRDLLDGSISVVRTMPGEVTHIWVLSVASVGNKRHMKGTMLDSGAAVNVCPVDYFPEYDIQSGRHIELQGADGSSVKSITVPGTCFTRLADEVMKIHFEVASVKGPIVSLAALEVAGWRLSHQGDFMGLRRGDLLLRVDRVDNVYWLFGLEGLDKYRCDLVTDRICGLEEIELESTTGAKTGAAVRGTPHSARSKEISGERQAHELTHLPARSWCETCVKHLVWMTLTVFGEVVVTYQRYKSTTCLWDDGVRRS